MVKEELIECEKCYLSYHPKNKSCPFCKQGKEEIARLYGDVEL